MNFLMMPLLPVSANFVWGGMIALVVKNYIFEHKFSEKSLATIFCLFFFNIAHAAQNV